MRPRCPGAAAARALLTVGRLKNLKLANLAAIWCEGRRGGEEQNVVCGVALNLLEANRWGVEDGAARR